jgi:hypothetical protein
VRVFGWYTDKDAPGYYRIQMPLTVLKQAYGWDVTAGKTLRRREIANYDTIIGQRVMEPGPSSLWHQVCKSDSIHAVFEIDDDLFHLGGNHDKATHDYADKHKGWLRNNIAMADTVVCTTVALADVLSTFNANVKIVPNYIDESLVVMPRPGRDPDRTVIGWQGSNTHGSDFAESWPATKRILGRFPHTQLSTIGANYVGTLPRGRESQHRHQGWIQSDWQTYYQAVGRFDIGIAPLRDNLFNRSKSWLKVLEYMALGVVPVATELPEYRRLLAGMAPGLLVSSGLDHEWFSALHYLIEQPDELAELSRDLRIEAARYTIQGHVQEWADALTPGTPEPGTPEPGTPTTEVSE